MSADELKAQGNEAYQAGLFQEAEYLYGEAIELDNSNHVLYSNRSAARLALSDGEGALSDAQQCVTLNPGWPKGHFRQGAALESLGRLPEALASYIRAQDLEPTNADTNAKVRSLRAQGIKPPPQPQLQHAHSRVPGGSAARVMGSVGAGAPEPDGWARGLSGAQRYEWLVDCYRMRVDDDYAHGGCNLHGLYGDLGGSQAERKAQVCEDFLLFCKLAVAHGVVPREGWDWGAFLTTAAGLLVFAFEKSDAQEKWGGENVFSVMTGGRSLRYTGEVVYGSSCMSMGDMGDDHAELEEQVSGNWKDLLRDPEFLEDVGGLQAWLGLARAMPRIQ